MGVSPPTYAVGQVVNNTDVNSWFIPLAAVKTTFTSRNTTTTLTADPDLTLAVAANAYYEITMAALNCAGTGNPGLKYAFTIPSGATGDYSVVQANIAGNSQIIDGTSWTATNTATPDNGLIFKGMLITTSAGSLTFTWAQNTSSATNTRIGTGSFLKAQRLA